LSFYLDSSVAVSAVTREPATDAVLRWLAANEDVLISDWLMTEVAAGLSLKRRMRVTSAAEHAEALAALRRTIEGSFPTAAVTRECFRVAAGFAGRPETGLRGGDALHLAVAATVGATLVTLDKAQAMAGPMVQVQTLLLNS
jgi:predicted nucleic acid-binding protein